MKWGFFEKQFYGKSFFKEIMPDAKKTVRH